MQITKDNLTIIIVTIKSHEVIDECLESIDPEIKKIIVENSSDEEFIKIIKNKYKNIECYLTGKNLGMGPANNFGIKKSKTKYVMILNPDTVLQSNTLNNIFDISKNLDFAILSPKCSDSDYPNYTIGKEIENNNTKNDLFEVDRVDGYAMILNKTKFNQNFFDEKIFMYLENDDLCIRTKKINEKIFVYSKSIISHLGASAVNQKYFQEVELSRNWHWNWSKFYFRKKHYGFSNALLVNLPIFFKSCVKCIFYLMSNNKLKFKLYSCRASGFYNSLLGKSSWYRPRLD
jgi:N-acetylglucosaminyl-diphospho-decaprenol L-rhamnosyltransferase|tara:strand:+ start:260 stop:1126 length:867 start_codon:yes stop_codon:yes gene_type:complete